MELYILRHGIAEARRPGYPDVRRRLTEKGKLRLNVILKCARAAKVRPALILTSPYARALETAELAAGILECRNPVVNTDALLPGASPQAVWNEIRSHEDANSILISGHEPLLSRAASYLLGASWPLVEMKKGALLSIDVDVTERQPRGTLRWLLTYKLASAGSHHSAG
jgi:phosphohistidine phosphatase